MGHKILLADDSITVQKIVKLTFSDEGIEVIAVGNGEIALQQLLDWQPDLVLADVFMPGRDGYEVCQFIRKHPDLQHIPVILLVHAFEPFDQARATEVGANCHLTKPFHSIRTLVTTVRELIAANQNAGSTTQPAAPALSQAAPASPEFPAVSAAASSAFSSQGTFSEPAATQYQPAATPLPATESFNNHLTPITRLQPEQSQQQSEVIPLNFAADLSTPARLAADLAFSQGQQSESGQLLAFGDSAVSQQHFAQAAPAPVAPLFPESGLFAMPNSEPAIITDPVSSVGSLLPNFSVAELLSSSFIPAPAEATSPAPGEVLDLEELLPATPLAASAEPVFDNHSFPLPDFSAANAISNNSADSSLPEPEDLLILAEVDEGRSGAGFAGAATPVTTEPFAGSVFTSNAIPAAPASAAEASVSFVEAPASPPSAETGFSTSPLTFSSFEAESEPQRNISAEVFPVPGSLETSFAAEPVGFNSPVFSDHPFAAVVPNNQIGDFATPALTDTTAYSFAQSSDLETGTLSGESQSEMQQVTGAVTTPGADHSIAAAVSEEILIEETLPASWSAFSMMTTPAEIAAPQLTESTKRDLEAGFVKGTSDNAANSELTVQSISPALIDEIVNRVIARMSEKAVQEIAWEVIPEMAELMIRRQMAEKNH